MMNNINEILLSGGIAILPTDTLYGIVCLANNQQAVNKIYKIKNRDTKKPPIVLISNIDQMFDKPAKEMEEQLNILWPGPNSIIFPAVNAPNWITRGSNSVAYRLITKGFLKEVIDKTGPLIAPSANPEGLTPARDISQAKKYFGDSIDVYIDGGEINNTKPSNLYLWSPQGTKKIR